MTTTESNRIEVYPHEGTWRHGGWLYLGDAPSVAMRHHLTAWANLADWTAAHGTTGPLTRQAITAHAAAAATAPAGLDAWYVDRLARGWEATR